MPGLYPCLPICRGLYRDLLLYMNSCSSKKNNLVTLEAMILLTVQQVLLDSSCCHDHQKLG